MTKTFGHLDKSLPTQQFKIQSESWSGEVFPLEKSDVGEKLAL